MVVNPNPNPSNLLEEYKALRAELVFNQGSKLNVFNYGLITLGLLFTATQFVFTQINEFSKSSSVSHNLIESLFIALWILLVIFIPFVCIIFIFKWLSNDRGIALISRYILKLESTLGMGWENELTQMRKKSNSTYIVNGGWHSIIILFFFALIGLGSQGIWWLGIKPIDDNKFLLIVISKIILFLYIFFGIFAINQLMIIKDWLALEDLKDLQSNSSSLKTKVVKFVSISIVTLIVFLLLDRSVLFSSSLDDRKLNSSELLNQKIVNQYFDDVKKVTSSNLALTTNRENTLLNLRGLTKEALKKTDSKYKADIIGFLYNLELLGYPKTTVKEEEENGKKNTKIEISCLDKYYVVDSENKIKSKSYEALSLNRADLEGITINNRNWQCINLKGANLKGANLKGSVLTNAVLNYTILIEADFSESNLANASLKGANLKDVKFEGTNLEGSKFQEINFSDEDKIKFADKIKSACNFEKAQYDPSTLDIKELESLLKSRNKDEIKKNCSYLEKCKTKKFKVCPIISSD